MKRPTVYVTCQEMFAIMTPVTIVSRCYYSCIPQMSSNH